MRQNDEGTPQETYCSKLHNWDTQASIRTKARVSLETAETENKLYFTPELAPTSQHPLVADLGADTVRQLLIQHLYLYLDFTAHLEHEVVNSVACRIAYDRMGLKLDPELMFDAHKICCDEAYHALFSADLMRQIKTATATPPHCPRQPRALRRFQALQLTVPPELCHLTEVFFCIVSETLISGILARIPHDRRVVLAVRRLVANHAEDEARHRSYFSSLLEAVWPRLTRQQQTQIGPLLPHFILMFLEPDYEAIRKELTLSRLDSAQVRQVMEESYSSAPVATSMCTMAKATLRLFEHNGVLSHPATLEAFQACGLRW